MYRTLGEKEVAYDAEQHMSVLFGSHLYPFFPAPVLPQVPSGVMVDPSLGT